MWDSWRLIWNCGGVVWWAWCLEVVRSSMWQTRRLFRSFRHGTGIERNPPLLLHISHQMLWSVWRTQDVRFLMSGNQFSLLYQLFMGWTCFFFWKLPTHFFVRISDPHATSTARKKAPSRLDALCGLHTTGTHNVSTEFQISSAVLYCIFFPSSGHYFLFFRLSILQFLCGLAGLLLFLRQFLLKRVYHFWYFLESALMPCTASSFVVSSRFSTAS